MQNFRAPGASPPDLHNSRPHCEFLAMRLTGGHKLNYKTFFLMILCVRPRKEFKFFLAIRGRLFAICLAANTKPL